MFTKSYLSIALLISVAIIFFACTIPVKAITTGPQNPASVPKEFDPVQDTLLVLAVTRLDNANLIDVKGTIKLDEELQKQYSYPYKIVSQKELDGKLRKYSDITTYRFALQIERRLVKQKGSFQLDIEEGLAYVPGYKAIYIDFAFYDRMTQQRFSNSGTSVSVMRRAVARLAAIVKKETEQKTMHKWKASTVRTAMQGQDRSKEFICSDYIR